VYRTSTILGITELEIERVHRHDFIGVWVKTSQSHFLKAQKHQDERYYCDFEPQYLFISGG
jgi:hypothetical protein